MKKIVKGTVVICPTFCCEVTLVPDKKSRVFVVLVTVSHCYYGYTVRGGPEEVGRAAGRAIRASIVTIALSDMLMTLAFWGTSSGIKFSG